MNARHEFLILRGEFIVFNHSIAAEFVFIFGYLIPPNLELIHSTVLEGLKAIRMRVARVLLFQKKFNREIGANGQRIKLNIASCACP